LKIYNTITYLKGVIGKNDHIKRTIIKKDIIYKDKNNKVKNGNN